MKRPTLFRVFVAVLVLLSALLLALWVPASLYRTAGAGLLLLFGVAGLVLVVFQTLKLVRKRYWSVLGSIRRVAAAVDTLDDSLGDLKRDAAYQQEVNGQRDAETRRQLRILRSRIPADFVTNLEHRLNADSQLVRRNLLRSFEASLTQGRSPRSVLNEDEAQLIVALYLDQERFLAAKPLTDSGLEWLSLSTTELRRLFKAYRSAGYFHAALDVGEAIVRATELESDHRTVGRLRQDVSLLQRPEDHIPPLSPDDHRDPSGPILHLVGKSLPHTQTGYTLRTHYTVRAQVSRGLRPIVVVQSGAVGGDPDEVVHYELDGVEYYILPGVARNAAASSGEWFKRNILELGALAAQLKPSILHAHSDFHNAFSASIVGRSYGIPTVYEVRGFWEETWLSRLIDREGWQDGGSWHFQAFGIPDAYALRRATESRARASVDRVLTLASVMEQHIRASDGDHWEGKTIEIVPNAVSPDEFPVLKRDEALAASLGIGDHELVVGYISSIVEYEGVETLIQGYAAGLDRYERATKLLIVGDGPHLSRLRQLVVEQQIPSVIFTGRVAHEDVVRYYSLIDIFVVPRKSTPVTELVTPLKPFEALATERALVFSDVGALAEIASDSGAALTFRAGDPFSLMEVLQRLISDPEERRAIASRGGRWVREHRSWESNASKYYGVYRGLGYSGPSSPIAEAELRLAADGVNAGELAAVLLSRPRAPWSGWFTIDSPVQTVEELLEEGWRSGEFPAIDVGRLPAKSDWEVYGNRSRSWAFHLHAWEFVDLLLERYDETQDGKYLDVALSWGGNWLNAFSGESDYASMAWYDMALALRTPRLLALTSRVLEDHQARQAYWPILLDALIGHQRELGTSRAFNPNNNHGFFTAASQIHFARVVGEQFPGATKTRDEGEARMSVMVARQFAPDGGHLEHSPEYHRMLLSSFEGAIDDGLISEPSLELTIERAAHALGWMIQPDGRILQFGDSPATDMLNPVQLCRDEHTRYIQSEGRNGVPDSEELKVYRDAGFAFVRSPSVADEAVSNSTYLAFQGAFHSRAHKHADDLTVVWFDRGREVLVDAGRFGYGKLLPTDSPLRKDGFYYAEPERQYVESTMAHNTVMLDGKNHDRLREPYGSALTNATARDGLFDIAGRVRHEDWIHRRRAVLHPGRELRLIDSLFSQTPEEREGTLWFNIAPEFDLLGTQGGVTFVSLDGRTEVSIESDARLLDVVRGQEQPLRGWRSRRDRELEPVWSIAFTFRVDVRRTITSTLRVRNLDAAVGT